MKNAEFQESLAMFNDLLINWDEESIDETEAQDWGIIGGESEDEIRDLAFEFRAEMKSERASAKDDYRQIYES